MADQATTAAVSQPEAAHPAGEAYAYGFDAYGWVALSMLFVFALLAWKKVHAAVGKALDSKIESIRDQLAEAESLRKEAEALRAEYEAKAASVDKDREALLERARHEAQEIVAKAKTDAEALVERRTRMAEDKIAAEERAAIDQLRSAAADSAAKAAARIIADRHDAATDARLVDQAIKEVAGR